jgi:diadenosine tetraphosphate (Ap4A) HIT family hydrolase
MKSLEPPHALTRSATMNPNVCPYCRPVSENVVWFDPRCRVIHIADAPFAGLCRVVWSSHVREFSDLGTADRVHVMHVVAAVERGLRDLLAPDKMNLASLGTAVPHLHWHIVPRYADDSHYPEPVWAAAQREGVVRALPIDFATRMKGHLQADLS